MIDMEIFRSLVWGGPLSQPAFSGSRLSVKNSFVRAHLVAKDSPGIYAGRGLKQPTLSGCFTGVTIRPAFMPGVD